MRFARSDLRTHIDSYKNDHRPSYWLQSTLRQQQCLKNDFREIFGVFRFSTFSTASTRCGRLRDRPAYTPPPVTARKRVAAAIRRYSITSSARASSVGGTSRPSAFAVLTLITSSILVGCTTGRSAGFAPLRT